MKRKIVCLVIPTLNEETSIGKVIDEIPQKELEKAGFDISTIVVDGLSTDKTVQIAKDKGATILLETRRGKGRAIRTALEKIDADYYFMLDGDFTYSPLHMPSMLEVLKKYPVVIGSRLKGKREKGSLTKINFIGNHILTFIANFLFKTKISDLCTGYWGFRKEVIQKLNLTTDGFQLEAELLIQVSKRGYKIGEIPILYRCRAGKAKLNGLKDGVRIAKFMLSKRFQNKSY